MPLLLIAGLWSQVAPFGVPHGARAVFSAAVFPGLYFVSKRSACKEHSPPRESRKGKMIGLPRTPEVIRAVLAFEVGLLLPLLPERIVTGDKW